MNAEAVATAGALAACVAAHGGLRSRAGWTPVGGSSSPSTTERHLTRWVSLASCLVWPVDLAGFPGLDDPAPGPRRSPDRGGRRGGAADRALDPDLHGSASGFLAQFFPLFLLGALFGKLMDDSGSVAAIASFHDEQLGTAPRRCSAVVLAGAIVTYGGVSLFVAFFVLAPMAQALFRAADIPRRLMPAAIALGTSTFTMSALPGTPAIQNAIPMPFFGTTPFAAPGLGMIAAAIMLGFGLWWLAPREAAARTAGEGYGGDAGARPGRRDDELVRERATTAREFDPAEIRRGRHSDTSRPCSLAALPLVVVISVNFLMAHGRAAAPRHLVPRRGALGRNIAAGGRRRVGRGGGARRRHPDADRRQPPAPAGAAREHGRRRQRIRAAGPQRREPGGLRRGRRRAAGFRAGARVGAVDRRRAAGLAGRRHQRARGAHRLGLGRPDDRARRARRHLYAPGRGDRASIRR